MTTLLMIGMFLAGAFVGYNLTMFVAVQMMKQGKLYFKSVRGEWVPGVPGAMAKAQAEAAKLAEEMRPREDE